MAARKPGTNELLNWLGLSGLSTELALNYFEIALKYRPKQLLIGKFDWEQLKGDRKSTRLNSSHI